MEGYVGSGGSFGRKYYIETNLSKDIKRDIM